MQFKAAGMVAGVVCGLMVAYAHAQTYPSKPIRAIVPSGPAGFSGIVGRSVTDALTGLLGQAVVIDYRAGADGDTGVAAPREAGEVVAARVAERFGQALPVVDSGLGGIRRTGDEWTKLSIGDLPDVATVAVAPALAREVGGIGGIEEVEGEFAIGEVEHGGRGGEQLDLAFPTFA